MVKKKGKSKRTTLKDKYKIQRRVVETKRKLKKQGKRDAKNGVVRPNKQKRDPGIPNSWPFKQELLKDIQKSRERQQKLVEEKKEKRKEELRALRAHQEGGGSARTVEELMSRAAEDTQAFESRQARQGPDSDMPQKSDGTKAAGQQSRRAYLRELKKVVDTADVILQVLDARDPISSRIHKNVEDAILCKADKRMVLVLNKIDLVPKEVVGSWLTVLRRSHPTIAIKASKEASSEKEEDATSSNIPVGMEGLLQLLKNYARTGGNGGKSKTTIVVGVVGYPNVGKSSIINALKRSRAVGVSSRPGFTTSMQEVVLDRNVRLLDSPGVVFDDRSAMLGNCVDADSIDDPIPAIDTLLQRCNPQSLMMTYNIPAFPQGNTMVFLAMVAKSYGRVLKGGIPDKVGAARAVLKDWNQGKIPYFTAPPKDLGKVDKQEGSAVIVKNFGKEFDLSKYDSTVLDSLKDSDEMDFVQLEEAKGTSSSNSEQESKKLAGYLNSQNSDDDIMEDDDDEEESLDAMDDDHEQNEQNNSSLAAAEDFDFESM